MRVLTEQQARTLLARRYGLPVFLWVTGRVESAKYQAVICDYSQLPGYTVKYAVGVYNAAGDLLERFNINKGA